MNENNYGTREACQRLVDAGIILKTENVWFYGTDEQWHLAERWLVGMTAEQSPAPSMLEAWRELPEGLTLYSLFDGAEHFFWYNWQWANGKVFSDTNPIDALIDLKIWLTKEDKP